MNLVALGVRARTTPGCDVGSLLPPIPKMVKISPPKNALSHSCTQTAGFYCRPSACWAAELCSEALLNFRGEKMSNILGISSTKTAFVEIPQGSGISPSVCSQPHFHSIQKEIFCDVSVPLTRICFLIHTSNALALPDSHPTKPVVHGAGLFTGAQTWRSWTVVRVVLCPCCKFFL